MLDDEVDRIAALLLAWKLRCIVRECTGPVSDVMDIVSPEVRSRMMAGIKGKNTKPEMVVRKLVHGMGFRYRLHRKDLPGSPDIVFPRLRKVIFVHGCFWHQHPGCRLAYTPKSNTQFWLDKLEANTRRDTLALMALDAMGWEILVVWECEVSNLSSLALQLNSFLASNIR
ncbi:very short patch repair endonuclease [Rhodoferax lithotrophicus]|nr:DNA mismatch endonuclease Vsr [Rhodoferax sp. MIZ03]